MTDFDAAQWLADGHAEAMRHAASEAFERPGDEEGSPTLYAQWQASEARWAEYEAKQKEEAQITADNHARWQTERISAATALGSGLVDQSQKMTVAARAMAERKTVGHRS